MKSKKIDLVIEKGEDALWGSVSYNGNLISDSANDIAGLESKLKNLLFEFENVEPQSVEFQHAYDVFALFQEFDFLNISKVAKHAEIHPGLLRQYASGVKHPSLNQAKKIEDTLHRLADQMKTATVYAE